MRLGKEPLLQFALGGALLFAVWALAQRGKPSAGAATVTGAGWRPGAGAATQVSRTVALDELAVQGLRASFRAGMKREPQAGELADLVLEAVNEEVLFREGLARGLDRDDGVVRRRVIEKMTALVHPSAPTSDPSREELRRWFETYRHRFLRPAAVTFDQLFFDARSRPDAPAAALAALKLLQQGPAGAPVPGGLGDRFVLSPRMTDKSDLELAHLYGEKFALAVGQASPGRWTGPLDGRDGVFLVRVIERSPARAPEFEEVEKRVRADWLTVETRGQRAAAESLLPRYEIVLPAEVRDQLASAPALAPVMKRIR